MVTKRPQWFMSRMVMFHDPAERSPLDEPCTSPEAKPANCPVCGKPLDERAVNRTEG
jgi:hypothetical protein